MIIRTQSTTCINFKAANKKRKKTQRRRLLLGVFFHTNTPEKKLNSVRIQSPLYPISLPLPLPRLSMTSSALLPASSSLFLPISTKSFVLWLPKIKIEDVTRNKVRFRSFLFCFPFFPYPCAQSPTVEFAKKL